MQQGHWISSRLKPRVAAALALLFAALLTLIVFLTPIQVQFHIAFVFPIFLCAWTRNRKFLWGLTLFCIAVAIVRVIVSWPPPPPFNQWFFFVNRAITVVTLLVCCGVAHRLIRLIEWLEDEHQRLSTILTTVPVGVSIADAQENTITYNASAARMLGVEPEKTYDLKEMSERFAAPALGNDSERPRHGIVRAMNGELVTGLERDFQFPDGRKLDVLVSAAPLRDRGGNVVGAVSGFVDITEQKTMQAELDEQRRRAEEASIRKSRFLAAVSHDIRTPANAISLLADLMERSAASASHAHEIPEIARDLKSSSLSLVQLVSDVLDITRFDSGRIELTESEMSLATLIEEVCRQFLQQMKDKGLDFVCDPPPANWMIRTDRVKLSRVLSNLLGNAIKFTPSGKVSLETTRRDDGSIEIRVRDTGPGIPPEHHQQIFDEYFQIKNPQRDHEKGSGLGLAICQRLAHAMRLHLSLHSVPGEGTTFTIHVPACIVVQS
jgi:hypothetical protein